jgi:hypothetical protein
VLASYTCIFGQGTEVANGTGGYCW